MNKDEDSKQGRYPFNLSRVFLNVLTSALSTFLALMLIEEALVLLYFLTSTALVTAIVSILKIRPVIKVPKSRTSEAPKNSRLPSRGRPVGLLILLVAILMFPFLLFLSARVFDPAIWFMLIASIASGIGISEILFYIYCEKW